MRSLVGCLPTLWLSLIRFARLDLSLFICSICFRPLGPVSWPRLQEFLCQRLEPVRPCGDRRQFRHYDPSPARGQPWTSWQRSQHSASKAVPSLDRAQAGAARQLS